MHLSDSSGSLREKCNCIILLYLECDEWYALCQFYRLAIIETDKMIVSQNVWQSSTVQILIHGNVVICGPTIWWFVRIKNITDIIIMHKWIYTP